jgi:perosamine synthetase
MKKFIPVGEPFISKKEEIYVLQAVRSGWVSSLGPFIKKFEKRFAKYIGSKFGLTVSNGTNALHLALVSLGIKNGDEVIVPDLSFIATANAVSYTGAKPVFVDVYPNTFCIDPNEVDKKINSKTKAIIPVHLYGHPAEMDSIMKIAKELDVWVIEDAAEAHGAEYKGKKVGSIGDIGVFSFYGNKIITTGEGGMLTLNRENIFNRAKFLKDHAMSTTDKYWHPELGFNYRMTNVQAALGMAQLERIETLIRKKRKIFEWYKEGLEGLEGIRLNPETSGMKNVFWMICLIIEERKNLSRDKVIQKLRGNSIDSRPFFKPLSSMPMYKHNKWNNPVASKASKEGLNLPSSAKLGKEEVFSICKIIRKILN